MNLKLVKGYVLAILALLILAAAAILLLNNLGGDWQMQVFWRPVTLNPAAWLLLAAGGGLLVFWTIRKLLPTAITTLRKGKQLRQAKDDRQRLEELAKQKKDSP